MSVTRETEGRQKRRDYIHVESSQYSDLMGTHEILYGKEDGKEKKVDLDVEGSCVDITFKTGWR
jgi:hypothetical protein